MTVTLALDAVMVALLIATIAYCVILERRLRALRADQGAFMRMIGAFGEATARAEDSIRRLTAASAEHGARLDEKAATAQAIVDELAFLTERAERLADRLAAVRAPAAPDPAPPPATRAKARPAGKPEGPSIARLSLGVEPFPGPATNDGGDGDDDGPASESAVERDLRRAIRAARRG